VATDAYGFVRSADPALDVTATDVPGLFAAGTALSPKDIVDTVAEASAVAARVEAYVRETAETTRELVGVGRG
jgi:heterodisulfide reductase subunit A